MTIERVEIDAFVVEDKVENVFTIFTEGKGGPIISGSSIDEAKAKFEKALKLSCAVQNLLIFKHAVDEIEKNLNDESQISRKSPSVNYVMKESA